MARKTQTKIFLSLVSLLVLMAVAALGLISCGKTNEPEATDSVVESEKQTESAPEGEDANSVTVTIEITDDKGEKTSKEYSSSTAKTLADILKENDLVEGEESEYGLMITTVNGIKADYNTDGAYWALYKNGEYMMTGADGETLEAGAVYGLVYTKG